MTRFASCLCLLALLAAAAAAPTAPPAVLEGIDDFLAAFEGFALSGDPLAEAGSPLAGAGDPSAPTTAEEPHFTEEAPCLGCEQAISGDSPVLRQVALQAAALLQTQLDANYTLAATQVYRATRQVVNGILYQLTVEVAETNCSLLVAESPLPCTVSMDAERGAETNCSLLVAESPLLCAVSEDAERGLFDVEMIHQPHLNTTELVYFSPVSFEDVGDYAGLFVDLKLRTESESEAVPEFTSDGGSEADPEIRPEAGPDAVSDMPPAVADHLLSQIF